MVRILHSFGCWRQRKKVTRGVIDHGSLPACSESSFYQNCVQQYFTTWRCICWWYETLRIRCIWGVPPVFGHKRSSKVAKWRSKQYTYIIYIYIYLFIWLLKSFKLPKLQDRKRCQEDLKKAVMPGIRYTTRWEVSNPWRFPKIIHFKRTFHYKPSSYWGTPICGNP